jgi:hypothetical protein
MTPARGLVLALGLGALAACNPPPRAVGYFKTHPNEAASVIADCSAGAHRGAECANAQAAVAQIQSEQRLSLYRKSF